MASPIFVSGALLIFTQIFSLLIATLKYKFLYIDVVCSDNWVTSLGESDFSKACHSASRDFLISVVLTFTFEKNIKNAVSTWGCYFDDPASESTHSVNQINTQPYYHEPGGFTINIPDNWHE